MESTRWDRIQELFHGAADRAAPEQRAFLKAACSGDEGLMADVLALLDEDARSSSPLDRGMPDLAQEVLATSGRGAQELGPYRLKKLLGEGGMGVVYLAERTDLGSLVAIKLLSDAWLSPARLERFAAEQRMLAQLDHPSIARLYDAGALEDGTPFFVMEYVDGKALTDYCREREADLRERLGLFRALCEAVQFAHRHAIIHRDIKPSNVLVKRDGNVRLLDFGIAKHVEHIDSPAGQTQTGMRLMTPAYAAPEQLRGDRVGIYTDVYSLGVVLYELLSGRLPFDRSRPPPAGIAAMALDREPERPSTRARTGGTAVAASRAAWADLDVLVLTAMHAEPQRRYGSVEALIRDIDHYLAAEPLEARPDTFGYRLGKFAARHRRPLALAGLTLAIFVGLVVFFTARVTSARNAALAQTARTQRIQKLMVGMLTGGDAEVGPGKDLRVVTLLDRGAKEARALDSEPQVQADLFQTLGTLYRALGELDSADPLLRSAIERHQALDGPESVAAMESLVMLGLLRDDQARYEESEQLVQRAVDIGRRHLQASDEPMVKARAALGGVLIHRNRYKDAIPILEEVVRLQSAAGAPTRELSANVQLLGNAHYYLGHYVEADALDRRALEMDRKILGEKHPKVGDDLYDVAAVQFEWGHYDEAEKLDRQAVAITEGFYGRGHPETASGLTILGRTLAMEGKLDEAGALLTEALQTTERAYGKVHPRVGSTLNDLGHVARDQGRLDDAEAIYRRQEAIYHAVYGDKHYLCGLAHANIGGVYLKRGDPTTAERYFREALATYQETLPPDHYRIAVVEIYLGRALVAQKRWAEAEEPSRAGYGVLVKQASPQVRYITWAREDLTAIYDALGQPEKASQFRGEMQAAAGAPASPSAPVGAGAR